MIEDAKKWADTRVAKRVSKSTATEYMRVIERIKANGTWPGSSTNGRTRAVERAAYRWYAAHRLVELIQAGEHKKATQIWSAVQRIDREAQKAKADYEAGSVQPNAQIRRTKRRSLRGLPPDWREQLVHASARSRYALQIQVMTLCGCRPEELAKGVLIRREGDELVIGIEGAKVSKRTGGGQPWRELRIAADHPLATGLPDGKYSVPNAKAIENAIDHYGKKLWPRRAEPISAYSLRHAAASDFKAAGLAQVEVAAALGHASTATMERYGTANGSGKGGLKLKSTEAARAVREPTRGARAKPRAARKKSRNSAP
jgi:integrase